MKKNTVEIFGELGHRLAAFGSDDRTQEVIRQACLSNPWFMPDETVLAARNITEGMLSPEALREWLSAYPALPVAESKNILIIMAGNIPFVGFQDLLCVLAAGHNAVVKLSSKDTVLMSYIISELWNIEPELPIIMDNRDLRPDAVIAMGGNDAVRVFTERYVGIPMLLRGSRSSLAILDGSETEDMLAGLAGDILSYSGLGCRNVSLVFVPRGYDLSLLQYAISHNRREMNPKYLNNYRQVKALMQMNGTPFVDCGACILNEAAEFPAAVSCINYAYYDPLSEVTDWMAGHDSEIQCVAGDTAHSRAVPLGLTQIPSLTDYPDGRNTMEFLSRI